MLLLSETEMVRILTKSCAFVRNGSMYVHSKLTGWHFGGDVGLTRLLAVWTDITGFGSGIRGRGAHYQKGSSQQLVCHREALSIFI